MEQDEDNRYLDHHPSTRSTFAQLRTVFHSDALPTPATTPLPCNPEQALSPHTQQQSFQVKETDSTERGGSGEWATPANGLPTRAVEQSGRPTDGPHAQCQPHERRSPESPARGSPGPTDPDQDSITIIRRMQTACKQINDRSELPHQTVLEI